MCAQILEIGLQLSDFIARSPVVAARPALRRRQPVGEALLDDLWQLASAATAEDIADLRFENPAEPLAGRAGQLRRAERAPLLHPEHAPHAQRFGAGAAPGGFAEAQQVAQHRLGCVALEPPAVGAVEARVRALDEPFRDRVAAVVELERGLDNGPSGAAVVLQVGDRARPGAVALEEHGAQRIEQRRLAHFIRTDDEVEPVSHAVELGGCGELLELVDCERAELHRAADSSLMYSTYRRCSASRASSPSSPASSPSARRRSAAARTTPPRSIRSRSSSVGCA